MLMFFLTMLHGHVKHTTVTSPLPLNLSQLHKFWELQESLFVAIFLHFIPALFLNGRWSGILVFQKDILVPTITEWWQPPGDPNFQTNPTLLQLQYFPPISGFADVPLSSSRTHHGWLLASRASAGFGETWRTGCSRELREGTERRV